MTFSLSRLNAKQKEAVLHGDGPLLILAGAGSGKTSTMTYRIAHLITERKVPGSAILGLSFTNKAARELKERVHGLVHKAGGSKATQGLLISTFHSFCVRMLRANAQALGFQSSFSILDENDRKDILKEIFRNIRIDDRKFDLDRILFSIGQAKSRLLAPEAAEAYFLESSGLPSDYAIATATAFGKYQDRLKNLNAMDFDDLLYHGVGLLEKHPEVRAHYNRKLRHILVDEYQDTNPTQFRLLSLLTESHDNLCVVGDDDQSIYSWRGADSTHILEFSRQFPKARIITLDQNYRSTTTILEAANGVIANNSKRHPKKLWSDRGTGAPLTEIIVEDDHGEADYVSEQILARARDEKRPWRDFAILYRSNAQSRVFEEALRRNRVPYKIVGGMSFLDRKEVKDVLSYWRAIANPRDDASVRRILNWPARGIGKNALEALNSHAFLKNVPVFEALSDASTIAGRGAAGALAFRDLLLSLREDLSKLNPTPETLADWGRRSFERIGAKKAIEAENEDPVQFVRKWENIEELAHSLGQVSKEELEQHAADPVALLQEFLTRMTLEVQDQESDDQSEDDAGNQVTLLTLHGAKGLEYPVVFLVGLEEGFLPHRRTIEEAIDFSEERRLCYVGITRARDHLLLTRARNRIRYGKPVPRIRSRFVNEIPSDLILAEDRSHGPDKTDSAQAKKAHEDQVKLHLSGIRALLEGRK